MRHRVLTPDEPDYKAIRRRLIVTWLKTLLGYFLMGGLIAGAIYYFGGSIQWQFGFGMVWILMPIVTWWFSDKIALFITRSKPADPDTPIGKRLIAIVDCAYSKSGLKFKPKVYLSDNRGPNAFATGPIHRKAVVAATRGLFDIGLTDEEMVAIFAHELGHIGNYDVGINSLIAVLSAIFFMIVDMGVRSVLGSINLLRRLFGVKPITLGARDNGFIGGIISWVIMYVVFWLTSQLTRIIQLFVVRSRESGADATAALMTGKPCDLAVALQKLVASVQKKRPEGRDESMFRAFRPVMIIDPIYDSLAADPAPRSLWELLKYWWKYLHLTHPPVPSRVAALDKMNGPTCPRIPALV